MAAYLFPNRSSCTHLVCIHPALWLKEERERSLSLHAQRRGHVKTQQETGYLQARKRALVRIWPYQHSNLRLLAASTVRNKCLLLKPPSPSTVFPSRLTCNYSSAPLAKHTILKFSSFSSDNYYNEVVMSHSRHLLAVWSWAVCWTSPCLNSPS